MRASPVTSHLGPWTIARLQPGCPAWHHCRVAGSGAHHPQGSPHPRGWALGLQGTVEHCGCPWLEQVSLRPAQESVGPRQAALWGEPGQGHLRRHRHPQPHKLPGTVPPTFLANACTCYRAPRGWGLVFLAAGSLGTAGDLGEVMQTGVQPRASACPITQAHRSAVAGRASRWQVSTQAGQECGLCARGPGCPAESTAPLLPTPSSQVRPGPGANLCGHVA